MRITAVKVTPIAVPDVPLLNTKGVHGAVFLRSILEVETDVGLTGLSETYGAIRTLSGLKKVADSLVGLDPFHLNDLAARVDKTLPMTGGINGPTMLTDHRVVDVVYSAFEIACLDLQGKALGRPFCDLLGGAVRASVGYAAYLFFKFAKPTEYPGPDLFGEVVTPSEMVAQAEALVAEHGFQSLKVKGGVLAPEDEVETLLKLRDRFPNHPLRIDPMGAWRVETAETVAASLSGVLEYLEDPVRGMPAMAELAKRTDVPLATNLVVVQSDQLFEAHRLGAVDIVLSDHHYWRGATGAANLGDMCIASGKRVAMHSNTHLGISLAAMTHVAAAMPELTHDCDTHYPWVHDDIILGGKLRFNEGRIEVPKGPGLGVALDQSALSRLHQLYLATATRDRDDTAEIRRYWPNYERQVPRW